MKRQKIYIIFCVVALFMTAISCNNDEESSIIYSVSENVRVVGFSLEANDSVLANLDTVFFTIDLNKGQIYNADSLPVGTDVSALIANITFDNVAKAKVYIDKGDPAENDTIDYMANPTDSIDFTAKVSLEVTAWNGLTVKWYSLKVNVHQIDPDSLYWNNMFGVRPLPCGEGAVEAQKSVAYGDKVYSYICQGGQYTLYVADNPEVDSWTARQLSLPFTPDLKSLQSTTETLYMLSTDGALYSSTDGLSWSATGQTFYSLQGAWQSRLLGITLEDGVYKHDCYPRPDGFTPYPAEAGFPIAGSSSMVTFVSHYDLESPQSILVGGCKADGSLTGTTWGYDGENWARLSGVVPPCEGAVLFPYFTFSTDEYWITTRYTSWILIGAPEANGEPNAVYVSINNGNTWAKAPASLSMPTYIKARSYASVLVIDTPPLSKSASPLWKMMATPKKAPATRSGDYEVPYIYLFGGENASGDVYNQVWRGAIGRLTYPPIP